MSYILLSICSIFPPIDLLLWIIRFESLPQSFWQTVLLPKTIPKIKLNIRCLVIMNEQPRFPFGFGKCSEIWVFIQNRIRQMKNGLEIFPRWKYQRLLIFPRLARESYLLFWGLHYQITCVLVFNSFCLTWSKLLFCSLCLIYF